ncbi:unnamed protein product [Dicrocoelium dendriticum]|nr:unnamed protein product [Dicrocoelium dendriticum]
MEPSGLINDKYYTSFIPTKSAQAIQKAGSHLYCCEDLVVKGKLGHGNALSSSLNHENVLKLYGSCVIGARFACLTEFINGGSLADLLSAKSLDLPWSVRISLGLDIAKGLHHLHSHNLIHRDLSSANILIRIGRFPYLTIDDELDASKLHITDPLVYGLSKGRNVTLSGASAFLSDCPNGLALQSSALKSAHLATRLLPTHTGSNSNGSVIQSPKNGSSIGWGRDQTGGDTVTHFLDTDFLLYSTQNDKPSTNGSLSLPVIEPVWKQAAWPVPAMQLDVRHLQYSAVVADLGLCLDLSQEHADTVSLVGHPYYIAPECLNRVSPYTFAADVFSFGLLLCELITRLLNDGTRIPRTQEFGLDHSKLPVPVTCPRWYLQTALDCCIVDHTRRPTLDSIISRFAEQFFDMVDDRSSPGTTAITLIRSGQNLSPVSLIPTVSNDAGVAPVDVPY